MYASAYHEAFKLTYKHCLCWSRIKPSCLRCSLKNLVIDTAGYSNETFLLQCFLLLYRCREITLKRCSSTFVKERQLRLVEGIRSLHQLNCQRSVAITNCCLQWCALVINKRFYCNSVLNEDQWCWLFYFLRVNNKYRLYVLPDCACWKLVLTDSEVQKKLPCVSQLYKVILCLGYLLKYEQHFHWQSLCVCICVYRQSERHSAVCLGTDAQSQSSGTRGAVFVGKEIENCVIDENSNKM